MKTRFVPFSIRTYSQLLLNVNEESTQLSIEEALKDEIYKKGGLNIYRVILQGKRKPELFLIPEILRKYWMRPDLLMIWKNCRKNMPEL